MKLKQQGHTGTELKFVSCKIKTQSLVTTILKYRISKTSKGQIRESLVVCSFELWEPSKKIPHTTLKEQGRIGTKSKFVSCELETHSLTATTLKDRISESG